MNRPARIERSLLERAAEVYDFEAALRGGEDQAAEPAAEDAAAAEPRLARTAPPGRRAAIDRERLAEQGFIVPDAAPTVLAEEFRIAKRGLMRAIDGDPDLPEGKRRHILVTSAEADAGKSFAAINLALSVSREPGREVLLVDCDFARPRIPARLGVPAGPGLVDAICDRGAEPERFVIGTDVPGLSVLPAGREAHDVTELIGSPRASEVLAALAEARPGRILIFDSPPALSASPASALALHAGQTVIVVRADVTREADLREAVALLSVCDRLCLLLNRSALVSGGRRFGSYYGDKP